MRLLRSIPGKQICAIFCVAMMLVFVGASFSTGIDRIQHAPGASPVHEHLIFSDFAQHDAQTLDHEEDRDEPNGPDRPAGSHHHHGDSSSGLIVPASAEAAAFALRDDRPSLASDRPPVGIRVSGPDRPPKHPTISA